MGREDDRRGVIILIACDGGASAGQAGILLARERPDYALLQAHTGAQARALIDAEPVSLVLLEIGRTEDEDLDLCRELRERTTVPIVFVAEDNAEASVVRALQAGADDYLVTPVRAEEFLARLDALLRRVDHLPHLLSTFRGGPLAIDLTTSEVRRHGLPVKVTRTEYRLLSYLARRAGAVVPADEVLCAVWGETYRAETHYLDVYLHRLRVKLEDDPAAPRHLITVRGLGYRLQ
ncbi:MAG: response regulator transcription factor [Chloroflexota bacterium]